jgi:FkbM family methyltransferase
MKVLRKLLTALRLLLRLDFGALRSRWQYNRGLAVLRRHGSRPFIHRLAGHRLVCFPDQPDSVTQLLEGGDDLWELGLLERWLQPDDAFVDAGANLGLYSHAIAGRFSGRVSVLAIEASPHLAARIREGAGILGESNLQAVSVAVGATHGEVEFQLARPGRTTVSQSMRVAAAEAGDYERHVLPMRPLAELAGQYLPDRRVTAVKVDVEGAEPLALGGAPPAWLDADGPLWLMEINPSVLARMNFSPADVLRPFPAAAFDRWLMPKYPVAGGPPARLRRYQAGENFTDAAFYNLIAVPRGPGQAARRASLRGTLP